MEIKNINKNLQTELHIKEHKQEQEEEISQDLENPNSTFPTIFTLSAQSSKGTAFYEIVELCRNNPPALCYAVGLGRSDVVKFLIDKGEDINARLPSTSVKVDMGDWNAYWVYAGEDPGLNPLEIAISQNDIEMVNILMNYHPTNRAEVEYSRLQFLKNSEWNEYSGNHVSISPLQLALEKNNEKMALLFLNSYQSPEKLFAHFHDIQNFKNPELMKEWIKQNIYLQTGLKKEISDSIVNLFLETDLQKAISQKDIPAIKQLLEYSWIVSDRELEKVFETQETEGAIEILQCLITNGISIEDAFFLAIKNNQNEIVDFLLQQPLEQDSLKKGLEIAYQSHAYEIMEMIEAKNIPG